MKGREGSVSGTQKRGCLHDSGMVPDYVISGFKNIERNLGAVPRRELFGHCSLTKRIAKHQHQWSQFARNRIMKTRDDA